jgi:conjugal transfer pilus assembly protein TraV
MKRLVMMTLILSQLGGLTACTTMNSSFDCPNKAGVNCKSLDQINGMVDSGQIRGRTQMRTAAVSKGVDSAEFQSFPMRASFIPGQPIRYGETVQRIWIAPYEDSEGNYHEDCKIYAVMKGGHWIGRPVKTVNSF